MFLKFPRPKSELEIAYDRALSDLKTVDPEKFDDSLEHVIKLHKMLTEDKSTGVKPDTMLLAATNILGILLVIRHENVNVITSRAIGMIARAK